MSALTSASLLMTSEDAPTWDGVELEGLSGTFTEETEPGVLSDIAADPNDLRRQRWGLVVPEGPRGTDLLELLAPLIRHREAQQGAPAIVYRVGSMSAIRWRKSQRDPMRQFEDEQPRYLLIAGDLDEVPASYEQALMGTAFVGRLAFEENADYCRYVEKLLTWEKTPSRESRALFYGVRDGTPATEIGCRALVQPSVDLATVGQGEGSFPASMVEEAGGDASPEDLLERCASSVQTVLFSLSHGAGPPRSGWDSVLAQRAHQGALRFPGRRILDATELRNRPFLPGGFWFAFACFTAGTPAQSVYLPWLSEVARVGPHALAWIKASLPLKQPFIAASPKAALANLEGPLGVFGHLDLAWSYSFRDMDGGVVDRPARLMLLPQTLFRGARAGVALSSLHRSVQMAEAELSLLAHLMQEEGRQPTPTERRQMAHLWMVRHDLAAFLLLGDPAARLLQPQSVRQRSEPLDTALDLTIGMLLTGQWTLQEAAVRSGQRMAELEELLERVRRMIRF